MAIVAFAVIRIGEKALKNSLMLIIAALAFIGIFFFKVPFPGIAFSAGLIGFIGGNFWKDKFYVLSGHGPKVDDNTVLSDEQDTPEHAKPSWTRAVCVCAVCGLLWWGPILLVGIWRGEVSPNGSSRIQGQTEAQDTGFSCVRCEE
jgi:chromate transporter